MIVELFRSKQNYGMHKSQAEICKISTTVLFVKLALLRTQKRGHLIYLSI